MFYCLWPFLILLNETKIFIPYRSKVYLIHMVTQFIHNWICPTISPVNRPVDPKQIATEITNKPAFSL